MCSEIARGVDVIDNLVGKRNPQLSNEGSFFPLGQREKDSGTNFIHWVATVDVSKGMKGNKSWTERDF